MRMAGSERCAHRQRVDEQHDTSRVVRKAEDHVVEQSLLHYLAQTWRRVDSSAELPQRRAVSRESGLRERQILCQLRELWARLFTDEEGREAVVPLNHKEGRRRGRALRRLSSQQQRRLTSRKLFSAELIRCTPLREANFWVNYPSSTYSR